MSGASLALQRALVAALKQEPGLDVLTGVFDTEALAAFREKFPAWRDADEFVLK